MGMKISTKHENGNNYNRLLSLLFISLVWIAVLTIGVVIVWLFDNSEFFIQTALIMPFSFGGVYSSQRVWNYYR
jgi:ABC-type transporter Mla subunit MlaD